MHHADPNPAEADEQVPDAVKEPDLETAAFRFDPGPAANNVRSCQVIMNQAEQVLRDPVVGVTKREVLAMGGAGAGIAGAADVVDRLEDDRQTEFAGDVGRAILAVVVDNDDLDRAVPLPFVVARRALERVDRAGEAFLLVPSRNNDREGGRHRK